MNQIVQVEFVITHHLKRWESSQTEIKYQGNLLFTEDSLCCILVIFNRKEGIVMEETNKMALASMIAGILSIVLSCCCGLGMIAGGLAVIFAGLSRVDEPLSSNAKVGLITGIIGMIFSVIAVIVLVMLVGAMSGTLGMRGGVWR